MKVSILIVAMLFGLQLPAVAADNQDDYIQQGKQGMQAFRDGNLIQAMDLLNRSAAKGYAPAQVTLAYILDKAEDDQRAFDLYSKAAQQGDAAGQYGLAGMYIKGEGTEVNNRLAAQWLRKSAQQQHVIAMRDLATALERGALDLQPDAVEALDWYRKCSAADDGVCTRRLAWAYARGELGLPVDTEKSSELLRMINDKKEREK